MARIDAVTSPTNHVRQCICVYIYMYVCVGRLSVCVFVYPCIYTQQFTVYIKKLSKNIKIKHLAPTNYNSPTVFIIIIFIVPHFLAFSLIAFSLLPCQRNLRSGNILPPQRKGLKILTKFLLRGTM